MEEERFKGAGTDQRGHLGGKIRTSRGSGSAFLILGVLFALLIAVFLYTQTSLPRAQEGQKTVQEAQEAVESLNEKIGQKMEGIAEAAG